MSNPGSLFWDLGIYVLIGFVLLSIASGWLRMFMDGYRRGRDPQRYRRIAAQVVARIVLALGAHGGRGSGR